MKRGTILFVCVFLRFVSASFADDYVWNDSAGGELGDATKWDPTGIPGPEDHVIFSLPNSYGVWLEDFYTHDRLSVEGSDLTLDLNGYEYTLDRETDDSRSVVIGDEEESVLNVSGGTVYSRDLLVGYHSGPGSLHISGAGMEWSGFVSEQWHGFFYGIYGSASVSVTDNAWLEHGHGQSAILDGSTAAFAIDGQDTEWYVDGYFGMSAYGSTTADVTNGARVRFGYLEMGYGPRSSAVINVRGVSHQTELAIENWWDPINLYLGMSGEGVINVTGSKLYVASDMVIGELPGGSGQLNLYDGSWADINGSLAVGGTPDEPGGCGLVYLYDESPGNGDYVDLSCAGQAGQQLVIWPEGTVRLVAGEITMETNVGGVNPIVLRGGTLEGWGWISADVENENGIVAPGAVGLWKDLEIRYDYTQGALGTLKIGIGGTYSAWDYTVLKVNAAYGQVMLDGFLDVDLLAGFVPGYEDEFVIIEAQSVSGQFINAPSEYIFEGGRFEVIYEPDCVILTHFEEEPKCPAYPAADFNKDCLVNLADLAVMAGQWLECGFEPSSYCPGVM